MDELFEALYTFALECRLTAHLNDPEYRQAKQLRSRPRDTLEKLLDAQGNQTLALYEEAGSQILALESAALFRVGLHLGLELSRL